MSSIKNLQMGSTICADSRIGISKSLLGLRTTATYLPTSSIVDSRVIGYSPADGERLKQILALPRSEMSKAIGDFRPKPVDNANYLLEVCTSRDGRFVALLLLHYVLMGYEPVTDVLCFEDMEAYIVSRLFNKKD